MGRLRIAIETRDLDTFGALLADDVRWGDDTHPRRCRSRADVVATMARGLGQGGAAQLVELTAGADGVLCGLDVQWPDQAGRPSARRLYHAYIVRGGLIGEIRPFDHRNAAAEAVGVPA